MNNHLFSAREVVKVGFQKMWQNKWTGLGLIFSVFGAFVIITGLFYVLFWIIDMALAYHVSRDLVVVMGLDGIKGIASFGAFFTMIEYLVVSIALSLIFVASLSRYWFTKMFVLQAQNGHVSYKEIMADFTGYWSVFWGQCLLNIFAYLFVFALLFFVIMPLFGVAVYFNTAYLLILAPVAIIIFLFMLWIFWLRMRYFACFVVEKRDSAFESFSSSYQVTRGQWWKILCYLLLYGLMMIGLSVLHSLVSYIPTSNAFYMIVIGVFMVIYVLLALMVSVSIYASDVYVYDILKEAHKKLQ